MKTIALIILGPILLPIAVIGMYVDDARAANEAEAEYRYNEAQKLKCAESPEEWPCP